MSRHQSQDVLMIRLDPPPWVECAACGEEAPHEQGLPVDECGGFVDNDYQGEWGGVPACRRCFDVHAAGGAAALEAMLRHLRLEEPPESHATQ